jgi:hypothetical protein
MSKEPPNFLECLLEELTQADETVKELARRLENLPLLHDHRIDTTVRLIKTSGVLEGCTRKSAHDIRIDVQLKYGNS